MARGSGARSKSRGSSASFIQKQTYTAAVHGAAAWDSNRNRLVVYGGAVSSDDGNPRSETWIWSKGIWTKLNTASSPGARNRIQLAYDTGRDRVVLFGGNRPSGTATVLSDTWEFDGRNWIQMSPTSSPPARADYSICYDPARAQIVFFGGYNTFPNPNSQTWVYDGSTWTQKTPATTPGQRSAHKMVWDSTRQVVVMMGGWNGTAAFHDTYEWNGTDWTNVTAAGTKPSARYFYSLSHDIGRNRTVMFGGWSGGALSDTWEWNGGNATWSQISPAESPSGREGTACGFDTLRGTSVIAGGAAAVPASALSDAWEWNGTIWRQR